MNARISYFFKHKTAGVALSLQAFDLLNQNSDIIQNVNDFYEEYVTSVAVRKFYLLSLNVRFDQIKTAKKIVKAQQKENRIQIKNKNKNQF